MALLGSVGKKVLLGAGVTAGLGIYGAGRTVHRMTSPAPERNTPFMDALFEATIGDPQADRHILGADVGFTDMFPLPHMLRDPLRNFKLINQRTWADIGSDDTTRMANSSYNAFTERAAQQQLDANRRIGYDVNATGDMVFGMYNSRQGF